MVRIAPVRLAFNPKTLWFEAGDLPLCTGDAVVVATARGIEYGTVAKPVFEMDYEDTRKLKSPLKPVKRLATDEDTEKANEVAELSKQALPVFKRLAGELAPDMNPVSVEYLFEGDKAVFYFDSDDRIDFRDLVRKLAAELHVRVDMKQIGVRDGARMVGGLGHCGQELCCRRLGGEFNPVSIRMAKEQDLSLNPQKISGICGRLMCCLRYEYDAYKDFHSRAPKKNAKIQTPDGEGKVVDLDVPREVISIKVGDEKPVKVPLGDMEPAEEGSRPNVVGEEAWERANEPAGLSDGSIVNLFTSELTGEDKLAEPGKVHHVHEGERKKPARSRSRKRSGAAAEAGSRGQHSSEAGDKAAPTRKPRRRRSTTVKADGAAAVAPQNADKPKKGVQSKRAAGEAQVKQPSRRRRTRSGAKQQPAQAEVREQKPSQVGRNSSALRSGRAEHAKPANDQGKPQGQARRRRRSHKTGQSNAPAEKSE